MGAERVARYERDLECDLAYAVRGLARFRVNVFKEQDSLGAVMRLIPIRVKSIDELGIPQVLKEIAMYPRGLVLVTGPTGSGKSTSLAAMVNHINENKPLHIITIEDPIEFMHTDKVAAVNQREVEMDTRSFADALKHVMRQNPDVILVGEMRDNETMQARHHRGGDGPLGVLHRPHHGCRPDHRPHRGRVRAGAPGADPHAARRHAAGGDLDDHHAPHRCDGPGSRPSRS